MPKPDLTKLLTIYGRKPVLEALEDPSLQLFRLHLAESNKTADIIRDIIRLAKSRNLDIQTHDKLALSRISKNSQQDQGVALDIHMPGFISDVDFLQQQSDKLFQLIAVDGVTNPQNLGMIIRSVCASPLSGLLLPKGCAKLDALVIKASAGTLFKCKILKCDNLADSLQAMKKINAEICLLDSHADTSLFDYRPTGSSVYVLGNESSGISADIQKIATHTLNIPMRNGVESLNVAITAALVAFSVKDF